MVAANADGVAMEMFKAPISKLIAKMGRMVSPPAITALDPNLAYATTGHSVAAARPDNQISNGPTTEFELFLAPATRMTPTSLLHYTSGSTGDPKGAALRRDARDKTRAAAPCWRPRMRSCSMCRPAVISIAAISVAAA
jgi:hypothetical protein